MDRETPSNIFGWSSLTLNLNSERGSRYCFIGSFHTSLFKKKKIPNHWKKWSSHCQTLAKTRNQQETPFKIILHHSLEKGETGQSIVLKSNAINTKARNKQRLLLVDCQQRVFAHQDQWAQIQMLLLHGQRYPIYWHNMGEREEVLSFIHIHQLIPSSSHPTSHPLRYIKHSTEAGPPYFLELQTLISGPEPLLLPWNTCSINDKN